MRPFRPGDLPSILSIEAASFPDQPYAAGIFLACHVAFPDLFLVATAGEPRATGHSGSEAAGAERSGTVVGYIIGGVEDGVGRVISIAVDAAHRRQGIARALCRELLARLERAGAGSVRLETRVDNRAAIPLWEELGFRRAGLIPDYYGDADALEMVKELGARGAARGA